jgi:hypothetical protein
MPFHPNSFSHNRFGPSNEFTTRFANNWALVVSLPIEFDDAESAPRGLIEISVLSGQRLLELDKFGSTTLLVSPDMYAGLLMSCQQMPEYDPNSDANETEVAAGIGSIRRMVSPSYSHTNSKKA